MNAYTTHPQLRTTNSQSRHLRSVFYAHSISTFSYYYEILSKIMTLSYFLTMKNRLINRNAYTAFTHYK